MSNSKQIIKVVWICHFTNEHIQNILKPRKIVPEMAPWITLGIEEAKKRDDIELHIVAPHRWINGNKEFKENNIHYHFFNSGIPIYGRHWPSFFRLDIYTNFCNNKRKVRKFVNKIAPDIIHLHGIENAYYSYTALQFIKTIPIFATIQGFVHLQLPKSQRSIDLKARLKTEMRLIKELKYFGVRDKQMLNEINNINPKAIFFWHEYFYSLKFNSSVTFKNSKEEKLFDIIYFARISKAKGIEDLISAISILKKKLPDIRVAIIGAANEQYIAFLKNLTRECGCETNINFIGFLPKQEDVYEILKKSKVTVLPTYNDNIPGTIIESMVRGIPVISYKTGGIPEINKKEEIILLSDIGDVKGLSSNIYRLLTSERDRELFSKKAYKYAIRRWDSERAMNDIINAYKSILKRENA